MRRLLTMLVLFAVGGASATETASAKLGIGYAVVGGATVPGSEFRYAAMSPGSNSPSGREGGAITVITQVEKRGGKVTRWWHLPGSYNVPAATVDDTTGGLSADGGTLVLNRLSLTYPPPRTRLAVLDTRFHLRREGVEGRAAHPISRLSVPGHFSFHAISPDGSRLYLIHHLHPRYPLRYEVRALDLRSGRLLPDPIADPSKPDQRMVGVQLSRKTSPDGRWAYTLYASHIQQPFIHALDTVTGRAVYVDLPQLADLERRFFYLLHLRVSDGGRELVVMRHRLGPPKARPLLAVDTGSFEVRGRGAPAAAPQEGAAVPWLPIGGLGALLGIGFALVVGGRGAGGEHRRIER